jgi:hypothetical protein
MMDYFEGAVLPLGDMAKAEKYRLGVADEVLVPSQHDVGERVDDHEPRLDLGDQRLQVGGSACLRQVESMQRGVVKGDICRSIVPSHDITQAPA